MLLLVSPLWFPQIGWWSVDWAHDMALGGGGLAQGGSGLVWARLAAPRMGLVGLGGARMGLDGHRARWAWKRRSTAPRPPPCPVSCSTSTHFRSTLKFLPNLNHFLWLLGKMLHEQKSLKDLGNENLLDTSISVKRQLKRKCNKERYQEEEFMPKKKSDCHDKEKTRKGICPIPELGKNYTTTKYGKSIAFHHEGYTYQKSKANVDQTLYSLRFVLSFLRHLIKL